jgi:hypothetical protein
VALCLATIAATLASVRLWSPARRLPFHLFAAGEAIGFVAGSLGSSAAVTRAGGSVAAAALTCVAYLIGIAGYALLIRTRSPGRDRTRAYLLMAAGWLVLVAADTGRALLVLLGTYDPASPGRGRLAGRLRPVGRGRAPPLGGHPHRPCSGPTGWADPGPAGQPGPGRR